MIRLIIVVASAIGLILFVAFVAARFIRSFRAGISIRLQVFTALAAIVGAFALGLGLLVIDRIEARAVRFASQAAEGEARVIARLLSIRAEQAQLTLLDLVAEMPPGDGDGVGAESAVEIVDPRGTSVWQAASNVEARGSHAAAEVAIEQGGKELGRVRVIKPAIALRRLLEDFVPSILVVSLILGTTAALAAAWIGRAIAHPIEELSRFSENVSAGVEALPPPLGAAREVRRLGKSIDSMRRQLEGRTFVETFAADLSHELKNPVAAVRASAEVLREGALSEPTLAHQFVVRILEATTRIERLLENLLSLAHIEARGVQEFGLVSLEELTREALDMVDTEQRARVKLAARSDVRVRGDVNWLLRAVFNLVDNALTHSPPSSEVELTIQRRGKWVAISTSNRGELDRHIRDQLFRRFVTTRRNRGGTGLGLAIVRAVAEAHRGSITLVDGGPPSVRFELLLPAAQPARVHQLREAVAQAAEPLRGSILSKS